MPPFTTLAVQLTLLLKPEGEKKTGILRRTAKATASVPLLGGGLESRHYERANAPGVGRVIDD